MLNDAKRKVKREKFKIAVTECQQHGGRSRPSFLYPLVYSAESLFFRYGYTVNCKSEYQADPPTYVSKNKWIRP